MPTKHKMLLIKILKIALIYLDPPMLGFAWYYNFDTSRSRFFIPFLTCIHQYIVPFFFITITRCDLPNGRPCESGLLDSPNSDLLHTSPWFHHSIDFEARLQAQKCQYSPSPRPIVLKTGTWGPSRPPPLAISAAPAETDKILTNSCSEFELAILGDKSYLDLISIDPKLKLLSFTNLQTFTNLSKCKVAMLKVRYQERNDTNKGELMRGA